MISLFALALIQATAGSQGAKVDPKDWVSSNLIFVEEPKESEALLKALELPEAHSPTWTPSLQSLDNHRFESKVIAGTRYWISTALLENKLFTAAEQVWALAQKNGTSIQGRLADFDREDQKAILSLLVSSPAFNGPGEPSNVLSEKGAEINLTLTTEIRDTSDKTLTAHSPRTSELPQRSDEKPVPLPIAEHRQIVMQSYPRLYDTDLVRTSEEGMRLLEELRRKKREDFDTRLTKEGIESLKKSWSNPKSWDGKSPIDFSDLDPVSQSSIRQSQQGRRSLTGSEKIGPVRAFLLLSVIWPDDSGNSRFAGASVQSALR